MTKGRTPEVRIGTSVSPLEVHSGTMTGDAPLEPDILLPVRGGLEAEDPEDPSPTAVMDNLDDTSKESP